MGVGLKSLIGWVKSFGGGVKSLGGWVKSLGGGVKSLGGGVKSLGGGVKSLGGGVKSYFTFPLKICMFFKGIREWNTTFYQCTLLNLKKLKRFINITEYKIFLIKSFLITY